MTLSACRKKWPLNFDQNAVLQVDEVFGSLVAIMSRIRPLGHPLTRGLRNRLPVRFDHTEPAGGALQVRGE